MTPSQIPKLTIEKSEDFKQIFADGVYIWLNPDSGTLTFFIDAMDTPELDENGAARITSVKRKLLVEIRLTSMLYDNIITWMTQQKETLKKI